jgi:adenine-specific DNA-methyltransferase
MPVSIPKVDLKSKSITEEQKEKLRQLFPEVFTEDKINFEKLQLTLGADVEGKERFGLTWHGKAECFRIIQEPSIGTLKPAKGESIDWDTTENLFIEGDNLETLKLLQKSYYGKVKMIYIDPPYNTGKEFIYPDKYSETLDTYLAYTGQVDAEGRKFSTNTETSGRYHSNWLDMMYPRLFLARNLLQDDGVIFVSIDDHEMHNLRQMMNEVFGEENFIAQIIWKKRSTPPNDQIIGAAHEYVLIYSKDVQCLSLNLRQRTEDQIERYQNPDNHLKGPWAPGDLMANVKGGRYVKSLYYPIINPNTGEEHFPSSNGNWRFNKEKIEQLIKNGEIYFGDDGKGRPKLKRFLSEVKDGITYTTLWDFVPLNTQGSNEMSELMGNMTIFNNPKPSGLILELLRLGSSKSCVVIDFFSGSCTTAHAVLELNKEDRGNRKFVMVQLPEPTGEDSEAFKSGYKTIADIGKERIRRVINKIKQDNQDATKETKHSKKGASTETDQTLDLGFRVFKLSKSNFKVWDGRVPANGKVEKQLEDFIENLYKDGTDEEILYELLLKSGFALTTPVTEKKIAGKKVYSIGNDALLICLEHDLNKDLIVKMAEIKPARAICLDAGFKGNDQLRTNALEIMKSHSVADFRTV